MHFQVSSWKIFDHLASREASNIYVHDRWLAGWLAGFYHSNLFIVLIGIPLTGSNSSSLCAMSSFNGWFRVIDINWLINRSVSPFPPFFLFPFDLSISISDLSLSLSLSPLHSLISKFNGSSIRRFFRGNFTPIWNTVSRTVKKIFLFSFAFLSTFWKRKRGKRKRGKKS